MSIREGLNERRGITAAAAVVAVLLAAAAVVWQMSGRSGSAGSAAVEKSWYTTDDGKSWFADDSRKMAPFDHNGKTAYRCYVYTADGGKTRFVAYLERYTPQARQIMQDRISKHDVAAPPPGALMSGIEVKPPGAPDAAWVKMTDPRAAAIVPIKPPAGSQEPPSIVLP